MPKQSVRDCLNMHSAVLCRGTVVLEVVLTVLDDLCSNEWCF